MFRAISLFILSILLSSSIYGQETASKLVSKGEKHRKKLEWSPAVKAYNQALSIESYNKKALEGIVDIYLNKYQVYDSAFVYINRQLKTVEADTNYMIYYNYANCLRLMEKHKEAVEQFQFFKKHGMRKLRPGDPLLLEVDKNINYCLNAIKNKELIYEPFEVENMDFFINSIEPEYTPVYLEKDNLLMYNARYKDYDTEQRDMDNKFFENIYYFDLEESVASTYNPSIEQKTHQCIVGRVFDSDSILVFYQNRIWLSSMNEDRLNNLDSLPATFGNYYFQPHGVFSKDQKTFIFSAREQYGNLDLYISEKENGQWSSPRQISVNINSAEDEDAPYLSADGKTLYFSSKGHNSSGGYDFFFSTKDETGRWSIPKNMGYPMNSAGDDIYITWNSDERNGFFSSNRSGGFGGMDIYSFGLIKKVVRGTARDLDSTLLAGVEIEIIDTELGSIEKIVTDEDGQYAFLVDPDRQFEVVASKEDYFGDEKDVSTDGESEIFENDLYLEKDPGLSLFLKVVEAETGEVMEGVKTVITDNMVDETDSIVTGPKGTYHLPLPNKKLDDRGSYNIHLEKEGYLVVTVTYNVLFDHEGAYDVLEDMHIRMEKVEVGKDLTDIIDLNPIYFDYNRYVIRADAAIELDKIVQVMNDNPKMRIELGSHTDSRGSSSQNQRLSERRAKASAEYIKKRITNPDRITGKGYGESKLINHCSDGVKCSEVEHQQNRRTEFIILEM